MLELNLEQQLASIADHFMIIVIQKQHLLFFKGLCAWVINIIKFYEVYCDVEPKRRALAAANAELAAATEKLTVIKRKVTVSKLKILLF